MLLTPCAAVNAKSLGLTGFESYEITGIADGLKVGKELSVRTQNDDGKVKKFKATCRIDTPAELDYYGRGGILEFVLRQLLIRIGMSTPQAAWASLLWMG